MQIQQVLNNTAGSNNTALGNTEQFIPSINVIQQGTALGMCIK
jgi:hypothetical protein